MHEMQNIITDDLGVSLYKEAQLCMVPSCSLCQISLASYHLIFIALFVRNR